MTRTCKACDVPNIMRLTCTIRERDLEGWTVSIPTYDDAYLETATEALAHVQAFARGLPLASAITITWEPRTSIGRMVVKVVTS